MPPLRLTKAVIDKACEMRAVGGSDGACARHAGVSIQTFSRWLHFGQMLRDYVENGNEFFPTEVYRNWRKDAIFIRGKLERELAQTGGILTKEHRAYLKLWDEMAVATDAFIVECQQTLDRVKNSDPAWALRGLRWFHPDEYREPSEIAAEAARVQEETDNHDFDADAVIRKLLYEPADSGTPETPEPPAEE